MWNWWHDSSIHRAQWPLADELRTAAAATGPDASHVATQALIAVRREKSEAKRKLRTAVVSATFSAPADQLALLDQVIDDVKAAGVIESIEPGVAVADSEIHVSAELEPEGDAA